MDGNGSTGRTASEREGPFIHSVLNYYHISPPIVRYPRAPVNTSSGSSLLADVDIELVDHSHRSTRGSSLAPPPCASRRLLRLRTTRRSSIVTVYHHPNHNLAQAPSSSSPRQRFRRNDARRPQQGDARRRRGPCGCLLDSRCTSTAHHHLCCRCRPNTAAYNRSCAPISSASRISSWYSTLQDQG